MARVSVDEAGFELPPPPYWLFCGAVEVAAAVAGLPLPPYCPFCGNVEVVAGQPIHQFPSGSPEVVAEMIASSEEASGG